MNISKTAAPGKHLRVHIELRHNHTLCGITFTAGQTDLAECSCKRCQRCLRRLNRTAIRGTRRLNGRKVAPNQIALSITP